MKKLIQFVKESIVEFKKVTWTTKTELYGLTIAIIVCSIILALFTGAVDLVFGSLVRMILS